MEVYHSHRTYYEEPEPVYSKYADDDTYFDKVFKILSATPCIGTPREPSNILPGVYLGSSANAENIAMLHAYKISYILNCDGGSFLRFRRIKQMYGPETGVLGYEEIPAEDLESFNIRSLFDRAHAFIDYARSKQGRILIHCPGVSRSGAIAMSYLIKSGVPLLQAVKQIKDARRCALTNTGFMRQLVSYARDKGMLEWDTECVVAPRYHRPINRHRIRTSYMPIDLLW